MYKLLLLLFLVPSLSNSQRIDLDLFGGMTNYQGDLQAKFFTIKNTNPAAAIILKYGINDNIYIRTGFTFGSLAGFDANNKTRNQPRNLNFRTALQEYSLGLEYRFFSLEKFKATPYVFGAAGVFHFNPFTYYNVGGKSERVYLQPLSTEGQGLTAYPNRTPYKLTQFCLPYGVGLKYQVSCNLNIGIELRQTKTFTDYLDDVSSTYVNQEALRAGRGQLAVDLAWRQDEYNGSPYPADDRPRGNPAQGDLYYFAGLTIGLKITNCDNSAFSMGGLFNSDRSLFRKTSSGAGGAKRIRSQVSCPKF